MREQTNTMSHSSQGDSPASRFPLPGSAEALKMTVTSGRKCLESSKSSPPLGCLEKMLLGSSTWGSKRRFLIWKEQAMKSGPSYYLLSPSARGMRGNGYSLPDTYPTPVASIGKMDVSTALIGRMKKTGTLKKLNSTGTLWQPNLCYAEAMADAVDAVPTLKIRVNGKDDLRRADRMKMQSRREVLCTLIRLAIQRRRFPRHNIGN